MIGHTARMDTLRPWIREKFFLGLTLREYAKKLVTPLNVVAGLIVLVGLWLLAIRFMRGLAAVTSASHVQPWGLLLVWGLFSGVPLAASGYVLGSAVYLFGLRQYHSVVKNAILVGFLDYVFAVVFLLIDLGRPWRIVYPVFVSWGPASAMFLVAWHFFLYLMCLALEFSPFAFEWLGLKTFRRWALRLTIGLNIFGVIVSTGHQSALGAMFLLTPDKLHPLLRSLFSCCSRPSSLFWESEVRMWALCVSQLCGQYSASSSTGSMYHLSRSTGTLSTANSST